MVFKHAYIVPILTGIWFLFTFVVTYLVAVFNKNVPPIYPYISDTGNWSPESCIFDILLTTGAMFTKLNRSSLYLGLIAAYGVIIVGSFQETNVFVVHVIGAFACFGLGTIYQIEQVVISFLLYPTFGKKPVNILRAICTVICVTTFGLSSSFALVALQHFKGDDITKWKKEDGGYEFHIVSVIAEWILAIVTQIFLATFTGEFKLVQFSEPELSSRV